MTQESVLWCKDERRRDAVRGATLNGLDYVEVGADQRTLRVFLLGKVPEQLMMANIRISGGRRIRDIRIIDLDIHREDDPDIDDSLVVTVDKPGDFSTYQLCLVELDADGRPSDRPLHGFDPRYACLDFSFKADCPSDLDCKATAVCSPAPLVQPEINYLAKDYASFRQLIFDRLALVMPEWRERHVPDIGVALSEVMAYVGDHLSYYQDAVATEAYLDTARLRTSLRRHARLVDYRMHEGCNARAWLCIATDVDVVLEADEIFFSTGLRRVRPNAETMLQAEDLRGIPSRHYEIFEPLLRPGETGIVLRRAHNHLHFYTWGDSRCCLAEGATRATLRDSWADAPGETPAPVEQKPADDVTATAPRRERKLQLQVGDILIFEEVKGPNSGNPVDADPGHRHAVCLTHVEATLDPLFDQPVVEIEWAREDALPFPLCLSNRGRAPDCELIEDISVACANTLLVDHGRRVDDEPLGQVPVVVMPADCGDECTPAEVTRAPGRFRPCLAQQPLTFSQPLPESCSAWAYTHQDCRRALPQLRLDGIPAARDGEPLFAQADLSDPAALIDSLLGAGSGELYGQLSEAVRRHLQETVTGSGSGSTLRTLLKNDLQGLLKRWWPQADLFASHAGDCHFVAEVDADGRACLRFGDGELGRQPEPGMSFAAHYRVGGGTQGNVGAGSIRHMIFRHNLLSGVTLEPRNPMPASGGTAPQALADVRMSAPHAFRSELQRAIIAEDYARIAERHPRVQRAAASLRWTGSWYEVLVAIDPLGQVEADAGLLDEIAGFLYPFRRIGHDLRVAGACYVALDIALHVCVLPGHLRGHVKAALLEAFSNRRLADGSLGVFHPDRLSFGEGILLSQLVATAQAVPGVESVKVTRLQRLFEAPNREIENGVLPLDVLEVPRLDNDPGFPEHGRFELTLGGGR